MWYGDLKKSSFNLAPVGAGFHAYVYYYEFYFIYTLSKVHVQWIKYICYYDNYDDVVLANGKTENQGMERKNVRLH